MTLADETPYLFC